MMSLQFKQNKLFFNSSAKEEMLCYAHVIIILFWDITTNVKATYGLKWNM